MSIKRYRTLQVWHNTLIMVWASPFVVLPGVIIGAYGGYFGPLWILIGLLALGLVVANLRDRRKKCHYDLDKEDLVLYRNGEGRRFSASHISDASLIDRTAAREYIREWSDANADVDHTVAQRLSAFTRYCTVDIGLTSFTLGLGRSLIDRLPNAKMDLVLLRSSDGEAFLLSPIHSQDLVERISRRKMRH